MKTYLHDRWLARARELFGPDPKQWRFVCAACGTVQTIQDFLDAGVDDETALRQIGFSCVGRHTDAKGCDWTLGGLFTIHKVLVYQGITPHPRFEFDEPGAGPEQPFNGKEERKRSDLSRHISRKVINYVCGRNTPLNLDRMDPILDEDGDGISAWETFEGHVFGLVRAILADDRTYEPGWEDAGSETHEGKEYRFQVRRDRKGEDGDEDPYWVCQVLDEEGLPIVGLTEVGDTFVQAEEASREAFERQFRPEQFDEEEAAAC